ncbi:Cytochrome b [hydrothermal vent metagenome]|uniref:Cytochrome b n=1 Tax=hydrothermal vent metagenome TaxID=652676 RepID=A0A3B0ZF04_9ZZZZ
MMSNEIRVWDLLVRIFHWSLVLGFTIAYLTGEEEGSLHIYSGYAVLGLITFRVIWGFIGSRYARFSDFVHSPKSVSRYLKSLLTRKPEHHTGHNPAGGWMVIAMLLSLFVVSFSGLKLYAVEEGLGPLAGPLPTLSVISPAYADDDSDGEEEFWEEIHEASANFMLLLIFLHITGVIVSSRMHGENLVKAMVTGKKYRE